LVRPFPPGAVALRGPAVTNGVFKVARCQRTCRPSVGSTRRWRRAEAMVPRRLLRTTVQRRRV